MEKIWRYLGQQCLNSFVLVNIEFIETPSLQEAVQVNLAEYENVLKEQVFLQDNGVSFQYSDSLSNAERRDLIEAVISYMEEKNAKLFVTAPNCIDGNSAEKCDTSSASFHI